MAKQPDTTERFRISGAIETSKEQVGEMLAMLNKIGFQDIAYEIITDVHAYKTNGPREGAGPALTKEAADRGAGRGFTREWIATHPSFHIRDLLQAFYDNGWSRNNAYKAANDLAKEGVLRKVDQSNYVRADVKALAPPSKGAKKKAKRQSPHAAANFSKNYDVSNRELMLRHTGKRRVITMTDMREHLAAHGRPAKSASPMIFKMAKEKLFKATGTPGEYTVTEIGHREARKAYDRGQRQKTTTPEEEVKEEEQNDG